MATKKVKKFGRGGDILSGLGAGLAAYGAYQHFFGDKNKDKSAESNRNEGSGETTKKPSISSEVERAQKGDNKSEDGNKEFSKQGKFPYEPSDGTSGAGLGDKEGPAPAPAPRKVVAKKADDKKADNKKADNKKDRNAEFANLYQGLTTQSKSAASTPPAPADKRLKPADVSGVGSNVLGNVASRRATAAANEKAAKDRLARFEQQRKESKEREARQTQAQNRAKSGTSQRSPSLRAPGSKVDLNDPYSMALGSEFDVKSMINRNKSRLPGEDTEYKKGGKVKKMASGGSVSSASKRADGIAMRGKTKGRMC